MSALHRAPQGSTPVNRRGVLRHPVEVEGQLSTVPGGPVTVRLTDISEEGCRIVRPRALTRDTAITLSFGGFTPFDATVVWTSPAAAGLQFDQPVHSALIAQVVAAARGRKSPKRLLAPGLVRREERERLWHLKRQVRFEVDGAAGAGHTSLAGELSDLSTDGCRIASAVALLPGTVLRVTIEGGGALLGMVRWCADEGIGVEFCAPLAPHTVERIAQG